MNQVIFVEKYHKYYDHADREYVPVSRILEYFGISQIEKLIAIHGQDHFDMLSKFGKEVHKLTAADDKHELNKWKYDRALDPYIQGWCNWRAARKPRFIAIEQPLASKVWGFAGTPDRLIEDGSGITIPDIKTGTVTISEEIQTAFYAILVEENYKRKVVSRYSVHLDPDKKEGYYLNHHKDKAQINLAKSLISIYNFKKERGIL